MRVTLFVRFGFVPAGIHPNSHARKTIEQWTTVPRENETIELHDNGWSEQVTRVYWEAHGKHEVIVEVESQWTDEVPELLDDLRADGWDVWTGDRAASRDVSSD